MASRLSKPDWLKVRIPSGEGFAAVSSSLRSRGLHTVCEEAKCPNKAECWGSRTATFMILGDVCTRNCEFCAVKTGKAGAPMDEEEPGKLAQAVSELKLSYVVLTSVDRDDLPDGGAAHIAATIRAIKGLRPGTRVEVLVPDFHGDPAAIQTVLHARPEVFNHNVETVRRLQATVRPHAGYETSLSVLATAAHLAPDLPVKSGLMVGLGETDEEVTETLADLARAGVALVTIGQYLRPSSRHLPVDRYVPPDEFETYRQVGLALGLNHVIAGPFVRSSYHAEEAASQAGL